MHLNMPIPSAGTIQIRLNRRDSPFARKIPRANSAIWTSSGSRLPATIAPSDPSCFLTAATLSLTPATQAQLDMSSDLSHLHREHGFQPSDRVMQNCSIVRRFSKLPVSTACCSESITYVWVKGPYPGQKRRGRQQLCNYCATPKTGSRRRFSKFPDSTAWYRNQRIAFGWDA